MIACLLSLCNTFVKVFEVGCEMGFISTLKRTVREVWKFSKIKEEFSSVAGWPHHHVNVETLDTHTTAKTRSLCAIAQRNIVFVLLGNWAKEPL